MLDPNYPASSIPDRPLVRRKGYWQGRMKAAGLVRLDLMALSGHRNPTITRQLNGDWESGIPSHMKALIRAWELMTHEQRTRWLREIE